MTLPDLLELGTSEEGKARLRVMLAELVGWIDTKEKWHGFHKWTHPNGQTYFGQKEDHLSCLPNFCADLNAVHAVEETLTDQQQADYADALWHLVDPVEEIGEPDDDGIPNLVTNMFKTVHITALQRTVALILTLQKP